MQQRELAYTLKSAIASGSKTLASGLKNARGLGQRYLCVHQARAKSLHELVSQAALLFVKQKVLPVRQGSPISRPTGQPAAETNAANKS